MLLTLMFSMNSRHKDFYHLGQVVKVWLTLLCTHKKGNLGLVWFTLQNSFVVAAVLFVAWHHKTLFQIELETVELLVNLIA